MKNKKLIAGLIGAAVVIIIGFLIFADSSNTEVLTGLVETNEIDVSSKIPGRIDKLLVTEGDMVHKGDTLIILESKEFDAKLGQGKGLVGAALSKYQMATNGARPEEIDAAKNLYLQASEQYNLAQKTNNRVQKLFKDEVVSAQERDQAEAQFNGAKAQMDAAKDRYDMAKKGARVEEIAGAKALYEQAEGAYSEIDAYHKELYIKSPVAGEVYKKLNDAGEIISAGYPVITIVDPNDYYVTFNVKEDLLPRFKNGATVQVEIPALDKKVDMKIYYIAAMADYATWKATHEKGSFDLKTFEVRVKPENKIDGLRPGMTIRVTVKK